MRGARSLLCLLVPRHCIHKKHVKHVLKKFLHKIPTYWFLAPSAVNSCLNRRIDH